MEVLIKKEWKIYMYMKKVTDFDVERHSCC